MVKELIDLKKNLVNVKSCIQVSPTALFYLARI